jgi:hypothetical protein
MFLPLRELAKLNSNLKDSDLQKTRKYTKIRRI